MRTAIIFSGDGQTALQGAHARSHGDGHLLTLGDATRMHQKGDIPIFLKLASGNQADLSCFAQITVDYQKQIEVDSLIVADYDIFTESNIKLISDLCWLYPIPLNRKAAQSLFTLFF